MFWPNKTSVPLTALAQRLAQDICLSDSYTPSREKDDEIASLKIRVSELESQFSNHQLGKKDRFSWLKKPLETALREIVRFLVKWLHHSLSSTQSIP